MSRRDRSHREDRDKGEEGNAFQQSFSNAMEKLRSLARRLVNVPRRELQQRQARYNVENAARGNRRKGKDPP